MRPEGWEKQLAEHIASAGPFEWGRNDCVLWSADWVLKMTGVDHGAEFRGAYGTEEGANAMITGLGFSSASALVDSLLLPVRVSMAGRGDIMLHPHGPLGICDGANAVFLTESGITKVLFNRCIAAWRV